MIHEAFVFAGLFAISATALWVAAADVGNHKLGHEPDDEGET